MNNKDYEQTDPTLKPAKQFSHSKFAKHGGINCLQNSQRLFTERLAYGIHNC